MKLYLITYDLMRGKDYESLHQRLGQLGALQFQYSAWLLWSPQPVGDLRNDLTRFIDADDRIFVGQLTGATAWRHASVADERLQHFIMRSS